MFDANGFMNVTYNLYHDLELRPPCTADDITRAYRKLALKYHPDKSTGTEEKFQKIKRAHEILKDPLRKKYYDKFGDKGLGVISLISPDGTEAKMFGGTSSLIGRIAIKILIKPTLLVPISLTIALVGIFFVMFLGRLDGKLYGSEYKTTPWYYIFALLWAIVAVLLVALKFYLYAKIKMSRAMLTQVFEFEEYKDIPAPRKRFLMIVHEIKGIVYALQVNVGTWLFLYCTVLTALNLDDNGKLTNGMTWSKLFYPVVVFFTFFGVVKNILYVLSVLRYHVAKRMWKERILVVSSELYASISSLAFFYYLVQWLDSSSKDQTTLFWIFSLIYFRIIFHGFRAKCESDWAAEDKLKSLAERNIPQEDFERTMKRNLRILNYIIFGSIVVISLCIGLIHSHISGHWPLTWSSAFFPLLVCVYCSIFVFGCFFPFILFCMETVSPPNSFHTFVPAATGEEQVTVIEIASFYRFGYGLAPIQRRITYR